MTTAVKKTSRTNEFDRIEREEMLKEDLERNVKLCHLLQKQGHERRSSTSIQTKGRRAEVLEDCFQQSQNSYRRVARH